LRVVLCVVAVGNGQLESLMWLREHGCPADLEDCTEDAARGGHNEVVEWLGQFTEETWHTATN